MKIGDLLKDKKESLSFEFFPPKTEQGETILFETIKKLSVFKPDYVSVTCGAGGTTKDKTVSMVERINRDNLFTVLPHLTGIGSSKEEITDIVEYYKKIGIENILAIHGDPPREAIKLPRIEGDFSYAKELVKFLKTFSIFSIGAVAYPEGHRDSPSLDMDMIYTNEKAEAGIDFLITQMFFDNRFFYDFLERADKTGINVPIIPGIMPVNNFEKVKQFVTMCGATIPSRLNKLMVRYENLPESAEKAGIDYTIEQCRDLLEKGIRFLHFYTLNQWEAVSEIITNLSFKNVTIKDV